jgi:hypothetical protein
MLASLAMILALAAPSVTFDQSDVAVAVGEKFTLRSQVTAGSAPTLAHLNVASLTTDVYVDPEDWSSHRTQVVAAGSTTTLAWEIQAVNVGQFDIYVVLLPQTGTGPLVVSAPVHVVVTARETINAGGSLPVVILTPLLLGALALTIRLRRRH